MKKIIIICIVALLSLQSLAQQPKHRIVEGSVMVFSDLKGKVGVGGASPMFFKVNISRSVTIGTALAPIIWFNTDKNTHSFGTAGFVIRADYRKVSLGCNLLTIAGVDTKFIGIGIKF
jgi:hypothetical protein